LGRLPLLRVTRHHLDGQLDATTTRGGPRAARWATRWRHQGGCCHALQSTNILLNTTPAVLKTVINH
jgi:hypothetical protein